MILCISSLLFRVLSFGIFSRKRKIVKLSRLRVSRPRPQPTRTYNTRSKRRKIMEGFEQENVELHSTVTTLQEEVERLTSLVSSLATTQSQQATLSSQNQATISEITTTPVSTVVASSPLFSMPEGYPWGMPFNFGIRFRQPVRCSL